MSWIGGQLLIYALTVLHYYRYLKNFEKLPEILNIVPGIKLQGFTWFMGGNVFVCIRLKQFMQQAHVFIFVFASSNLHI